MGGHRQQYARPPCGAELARADHLSRQRTGRTAGMGGDVMDADRLNAKLQDAGCVATSAGIIAVDTQLLIQSFLNALETIERLEGDIRELTPAPDGEFSDLRQME